MMDCDGLRMNKSMVVTIILEFVRHDL